VSEKIDLDEQERRARAAATEAPGWWRPGAVEKYNVFCQHDDGIAPPLGRVLLRMNIHFPHEQVMEHIAANNPPVTLALIARIRELEMALADALYWLKPGLDHRATEMEEESTRMSAILAKGAVLP